jgi:hypothetical protein
VAGGVIGVAAVERQAAGEPDNVSCVVVVVTPDDLGGEIGGWAGLEVGRERGEERG